MPADTDLEFRRLIVRYLTINNQLLITYQQHKTGKRQRMQFVDQILCQWGILQQSTFQGWTMLPMSTLVNTARLWFSLWSKIDPVDRKNVMIWSFKRNDKCFQNLQWVLKEFRDARRFVMKETLFDAKLDAFPRVLIKDYRRLLNDLFWVLLYIGFNQIRDQILIPRFWSIPWVSKDAQLG